MKRGFRFQWLALCVVIAVCAATAAAGGAGAGPTAREGARELRLEEAVLQVEVAREALATAQRMVEEHMAPSGSVRERQLDLVRAERALAEVEGMERQRVSLDVSEATLTAALTTLFKGTGQSLILDPAVAQAGQSVTLKLNDVSLESAVRAICKLHGLEYETDNQGLWVITASPDVARVGGAAFPIYGVTSVTPGGLTTRDRPRRGGVTLSPSRYESAPRVSYGGQAPAELEGRTDLAGIGLSGLVDLDVENAPLGEVAAQLGVKHGEEWQVEILVHEAVPEDITVTAKVYRMRRDEVLLLLAEQTNLDISIDSPMPGERTLERPHTRVYFVPRPELDVSGLGVGGETTILLHSSELDSSDSGLEQRVVSEAAGREYEAARRRAEEAQKVAEQLRQEMWVTVDSAGNILGSCRQCGALLSNLDWKYCPFCGTPITPEEKQPEGAD